MYCAIPPRRLSNSPCTYVQAYNAFKPEECDKIIQLAADTTFAPGTMYDNRGNAYVDHERRVVDLHRIHHNADTKWIFNRVMKYIVETNSHYNFDIRGITEPGYLLRYTEGHDDVPNGHCNWHQDTGYGVASTRKLSVTVQLSDEKDYEGGELAFFTNGEQVAERRERGSIIMFPSYLPHRVKPVTKGTRYALVVWIAGEPFR